MQNDNFNLMAAENLPFLLSQIDLNTISQNEKRSYEELVRWNYYNDAKLLAPVYFEEWISSLMKMVYQDEFDTANVPMPTPEKYVVLQLLKNQTSIPFWDNKKTVLRETSQMLIRMSFAESAEKTQEWRRNIMTKEDKFPYWANYKQSSIQHLARIAPFSEFYIQNGGNKGVINANFGQHGASWRMVVELNPQGVKAYGVYPGGQSGNVGSQYYTNQLKSWEKGEYFDLQFWKDKKAGGKQILFVQESK
jgi:penicillin amidase